ncbi:MAG TPA: UDP-N-acetylmuramate dehydrogenase [Candidatus Saccharimonadales bacterium]|nr:UDP-N-acetylmuramate dehydrogenase [Candidatus Saccharimonadales bacterium]
MDSLQPLENVPLSRHSTMRLGGPAKYLLDITSPQQIEPALQWAAQRNCKVIMIGDGSNIVWNDQGFDGLVLVNKIMGFELQDQEFETFVNINAGENWDSTVAKTVEAGLSGIENLSLIPGTAGATPVQNVGAYGKEIADTLVCVQAYDTLEKKMVVIPKTECDFSYRKSRFNGKDKGRFMITSITLALSKNPPMPPFYGALQTYLSQHNITTYTPQIIRKAVMAVRNSKLPDPAKVANCGSFFANPIIEKYQLEELIDKFPGIPHWDIGDNTSKISAAWMLDQMGLKGYHEPNTGMATWDKHALVFVNEKAKDTASLIAFRDAIIKKAEEKFGVTLKQEPELI